MKTTRHVTQRKSRWPWIAATALCLAVGAVAAVDSEAEADREDAEAIASRDWAARQVCAGKAYEWVDDKTLVCFKEIPTHTARAAAAHP